MSCATHAPRVCSVALFGKYACAPTSHHWPRELRRDGRGAATVGAFSGSTVGSQPVGPRRRANVATHTKVPRLARPFVAHARTVSRGAATTRLPPRLCRAPRRPTLAPTHRARPPAARRCSARTERRRPRMRLHRAPQTRARRCRAWRRPPPPRVARRVGRGDALWLPPVAATWQATTTARAQAAQDGGEDPVDGARVLGDAHTGGWTSEPLLGERVGVGAVALGDVSGARAAVARGLAVGTELLEADISWR